MVRTPKDGLRKGAWSEEEDNKLRAYILRCGHWNWRLLPKYAGLARSGKSCRLRWVNYLKPGLKQGDYSQEEAEKVKKLHDKLGNKWSTIAAQLPGRTDNSIKNYWHVHMKKHSDKITTVASTEEQSSKSSQSEDEINQNEGQSPENVAGSDISTTKAPTLTSQEHLNSYKAFLATDTLRSLSCNKLDIVGSTVEQKCRGEEISRSRSSLALNFAANEDFASSSDSSFGVLESFWNEPFIVDTSDSHDLSSFSLDELETWGNCFSPRYVELLKIIE